MSKISETHPPPVSEYGMTTKAALQLVGVEAGRPCKCSASECHVRKRRTGGFRVVLRGSVRREEKIRKEKPLVSILCPTIPERRPLHGLLYECYTSQTYACHCELIVFESGATLSSSFFNDKPDVTYIHDPRPHLSVGYKRNVLLKRARGDIVCMFDDDNVYSPKYIETMLLHLLSSGAKATSLAGFFGVRLETNVWESYRNVGGRGETLLFFKEGANFDDKVTWGEEKTMIDGARPGGMHRIWDDVGLFIHVDHGKNLTAVRPVAHDKCKEEWFSADSGVEWRSANRDEVSCKSALDILDRWRRAFDMVWPTQLDPKGDQAPDAWYDLPDHLKDGHRVLPRLNRPSAASTQQERRVRQSDVIDLQPSYSK